MRIICISIALLFIPAVIFADTLYVPDDYDKIQDAINSAGNGDVIIVKPGTYVENINYLGKAVFLRSELGPAVTILDGGNPANPNSGSTVSFKSGEDKDSVLEGFTITNGSGSTCPWGYIGGGILCESAAPTISNNVISFNTTEAGGGIYCYNGDPTVSGNIISMNEATGKVDSGGGGIFCEKSSAVLSNNILFGNDTRMGGGILCFAGSAPVITNNTVFGNTATGSSGSGGGGIWCGHGSAPVVTNTIFWNNSAPSGPEIWLGISSDPSTLTIGWSDVEGGQASVHVETGCTLDWGSGMIDSDPLFVDPIDGDLHLTFCSPCRDAGDNTASHIPDEDFEGDPRTAYGTADMGADEFHTHLYCTGDATPGGNVEVKIVDLPDTSPVGLCIGTGVLNPPIPSMWGDWYLKFPFIGPIDLGKVPSPTGVLILPGMLPGLPPAPYSIPMQALLGDTLTNLCVLDVK